MPPPSAPPSGCAAPACPSTASSCTAAAEGDVDPGGHRAGDGLFGALSTLLVPESDLHAYERGLGRGGAVLIARDVPHERVSDAAAALEEDAVEIDDEPALKTTRTKAPSARLAASGGRPATSIG